MPALFSDPSAAIASGRPSTAASAGAATGGGDRLLGRRPRDVVDDVGRPLANRRALGERAAVTKRDQPKLRALAVRGALTLLMLAAGCRGRKSAADTARALPPVGMTPAGPPAKDACPADGRWAACSLLKRLDEAGLAPQRDSSPVTLPPLSPSGVHVTVGGSELDLFFYPDSAARARDEAKLDRKQYIAYDAPQTIRAEPTLIHSANVIAILHSRRDQQRERVSDAITAGPPQPSSR